MSDPEAEFGAPPEAVEQQQREQQEAMEEQQQEKEEQDRGKSVEQATDGEADGAETQETAEDQGDEGPQTDTDEAGSMDATGEEEKQQQGPADQQDQQEQPEEATQEEAEAEAATAQDSQAPDTSQADGGPQQGQVSEGQAEGGEAGREEERQANADEQKAVGGQHDAAGTTGEPGDAPTADAGAATQPGEEHRNSSAGHLGVVRDIGPELPELPATAGTNASGDESATATAAADAQGEEATQQLEEGQTENLKQGGLESGLTELKEASQAQEGDSGSGVPGTQDSASITTGLDSAHQQRPQQQQQAGASATQAAADDDAASYTERQQMVKVKLDDGQERIYNLTVMTTQARKPFLGGYRHKKTGVEYHNASCQTPRKFRLPKKELFTRTTQTAIQRTHPKFATQTSVHTATQMTKEGVFVTSQQDKVIAPTVYETAADRHARLVAAVVVIQKFYRRWKAKRMVGNLRYAKQQYEHWLGEKEHKRLEFEEMMRQREFDRRLNPRTAEDFDMLYASLQKWHAEELERIRLLPESEQYQARMDLLREETKYLNYIEQLKQMASKDNKEARVQKFLQDASGGRTWINKEYGKKVQVETPDSKLAQELRDIYNLISIPDLDVDERLDALLQLKRVVEKHDSRLTREILELVQREADLLGRRTRIRNLEGLRKRLLNLFLQFVETPDYNPEAKRLMEVHQEKDFFKHNLVRCAGTQSFHTTSKFEVSPQKTTGLGKSRAVLAAENRALHREDNTVYRRMLDVCRKREKAFGDNSQCMLLMSVRDMRYLVETIWGGKSILSDEASAIGLELCRWDKSKELTPWNSVLLTREEAEEHLSLPSVHESYGPSFVAKVNQRHIRAKQHFASLQSHLARAHRQVGKAPPKPRQLPSVASHHLKQQQQVPATSSSSSAA